MHKWNFFEQKNSQKYNTIKNCQIKSFSVPIGTDISEALRSGIFRHVGTSENYSNLKYTAWKCRRFCSG